MQRWKAGKTVAQSTENPVLIMAKDATFRLHAGDEFDIKLNLFYILPSPQAGVLTAAADVPAKYCHGTVPQQQANR